MTTVDERTVWAWGANNCGQLGCGDTEDRLTPIVTELSDHTVVTRPDELLSHASPLETDTKRQAAEIAVNFGGGGAFSLFLTDSGRVFTCGKNDRGQLGQGTGKTDQKSFTNVLQFLPCALANTLKVKEVQAGWDFVVVLTDSSSLFTWGSNSFGQLGRTLAAGIKMDSTPCVVSVPSSSHCKFVAVAAGLRHALAVSELGHVYSWGSGRRGQLGVMDAQGKPTQMSTVPVCVSYTSDDKAIQAFAGMNFSGILTATGVVYLWGCNKYGQCGSVPTTEVICHLPKRLEMPPILAKGSETSQSKPSYLKAGWTHVIMRTATGELYSLGRSDLGQLGRSIEHVPHYVPGRLDGIDGVVNHCCSSEHNLAVTDKGQLYSWGWNEHGICGTGDETNVFYPLLISSLRGQQVLCIGCGAGHCFCVTKQEEKLLS